MADTLARNAPIVLYVIAFVMLIVYRQPFFLYHLIASFVIGVGGNALLKAFFRRVLHRDSYLARRPNPDAQCGVAGTHIDKASVHSFGFPSGHLQSVTTSLVMLVWWIAERSMYSQSVKAFLYVLSGSFALYVGYSRVHDGCHNVEQVSVGALAGVLGGLLSVKLWLEAQ
jgi:membrane-associated phospholipid phosphatase